MLYDEGPDIFFHIRLTIVPSASAALPFNAAVFVGNVIISSEPALAIGGKLAAVLTVT